MLQGPKHLLELINNPQPLFKDPLTFNPARFIDDNGLFVKNERVIPFGIGRFYKFLDTSIHFAIELSFM